jgi:transposase
MTIIATGIDLAKTMFAVHGVSACGVVQSRQPKVTHGKEACSGAHHWARQFLAYGHIVRLMAPKLVTPYGMSGKRGKNDAADAAAICEGMQRPNMRFVPIKTEQQQAQLMVRRARQGFVTERTACINCIQGLLTELGIVLPSKAEVVLRQVREHLEDLLGDANLVSGDLLSEVAHLDERISQYDRHVHAMARQSTAAQRLMQLMGIGEATATALVAMVDKATEYSCGRQFAAWIRLVPGQCRLVACGWHRW